jgi:hypothetical protein
MPEQKHDQDPRLRPGQVPEVCGPTPDINSILGVLHKHEAQIAEGAHNHHVVTQQVVETTHQIQHLHTHLPEMIAQALVKAIGSPDTWAAGKKAAATAAQDAAGSWLLGMIKFMFEKALWGVLFLVAIYWVGGMPALASFLKLKWGSTS